MVELVPALYVGLVSRIPVGSLIGTEVYVEIELRVTPKMFRSRTKGSYLLHLTCFDLPFRLLCVALSHPATPASKGMW